MEVLANAIHYAVYVRKTGRDTEETACVCRVQALQEGSPHAGKVPPGSDPVGAPTSGLRTPDCEKGALPFKGTPSVV